MGTPAPNKKGLGPKQLGVVAILILAGGLIWSFSQYQEAKNEVARLSQEINEQQAPAEEDTGQLLEQVRRHLVLPEDEAPTVGTISDADQLREAQPFFAQAQNGDKVLIYVNSRRSILYSPERDVVVNVGALVVNSAADGVQTETAAADEEPQVAGDQDEN